MGAEIQDLLMEVIRTGIREMRVAKELTQDQLAAAVGVTQGAVVQWENGTTAPRFRTLPRLAEVLGVPVDKLVEAINENEAREC